jgi:hypothetical protein
MKNFFKMKELSLTTLQNQEGIVCILDDRERSIRVLGNRREEMTLPIFIVDNTLQQISSNSKKERGQRITLPDPSLAFELFASHPIKKHRCNTPE